MAGNKAKEPSTEDKLRELIRTEFGSLFDERDKKQKASSETNEQRWIRDAMREIIGEELDRRFEEFAKGLEGDGDGEERDAGGGDGGGFLRALTGGGGR